MACDNEEGDGGVQMDIDWIDRLKEYEAYFKGIKGIGCQEDVVSKLKQKDISFDEGCSLESEWKTPKISL